MALFGRFLQLENIFTSIFTEKMALFGAFLHFYKIFEKSYLYYSYIHRVYRVYVYYIYLYTKKYKEVYKNVKIGFIKGKIL